MSVNELGILSSPISILSGANHGGLISDDYLLLADQKQPDGLDREQQTPDGYISKQLDFRNLTKSIKTDFDMSDIEAKLRFMEKQLEVPSSLMVIKNKGHAQKYVISALSENKRANLDGASCYNFTESVKDILNKITLPKISALVSPWLMQISVRNEYGNSVVQAASQSLAQRTEEEMEDIYLPRSWALNRIARTTESEKYATSSKLAYYLYRHIYENYLRNAKVVNQVGTDTTAAASQALMNSISSIAKVRLHSKYPANVMGNSDVSAASQKLANALCTQISSEFKRYDDVGPYLQRRHVATFLGDHTDWAASQKLIYGLCSIVDSYAQPPLPWQEGNVLYMTPNGQGKSQTIATFDAYVCESDEDKIKTKQEGLTLKKVFNTWQRGGYYHSRFYEDNPELYTKTTYGGLEVAARCWGVDLDVLDNGTPDEMLAELGKRKTYEEIRNFYRHFTYTGYTGFYVRSSPVYHVLSDPPQSEGGNDRSKIFSTDQISNVLPDIYGNTSGTCFHHLTSPDGVLHTDDILNRTAGELYYSERGAVISVGEYTFRNIYIECIPQQTLTLLGRGDMGYPYWFYNSYLNTIVQPFNTSDETYFFSVQKYTKYSFTVRVFSKGDYDDDYIGIIIGHSKQTNGNSSFIVACRTPNAENDDSIMNHWSICRAGRNFSNVIASGHIGCSPQDIIERSAIITLSELSNSNTNQGHYAKSYVLNNLGTEEVTKQYFGGKSWTYEPSGAWSSFYDRGGVLIKVNRDGNKISAWTTEFGQDPIESNLGHMLTVDLESHGKNFFGFELSGLQIFKGDSKIGLYSMSQAMSMFEIKEFNVPVVIADTRTNQIIDFYMGRETVRPGVNALEYLGAGRFQKNPYTEKLFYIGKNEFIKVYQPGELNLITEDRQDMISENDNYDMTVEEE